MLALMHAQLDAGTSVHDITDDVRTFVANVGDNASGTLTVTSRHTTTAVCINEMESRLVEDLRLWYHRQAPPGDMYLHNDLDRREAPGVYSLAPGELCGSVRGGSQLDGPSCT